MNRTAFYIALRRRDIGLFGTSLSQKQVEGVEAILDACEDAGASLPQTAYMLATPYGETGGKMQAVRENLNYSAQQVAKHFGAHRWQGYSPDALARNPVLLGNIVYGGPWGAKHLGNTQPGDGYNFRGFGMGQWTGRRNTLKAAAGIGLDLVGNPALLNDATVNAKLLVDWMMNGRATGKKLTTYINARHKDYRGARAVWGGVDAEKYVKFAQSFEAALKEGGWKKGKPRTPPPVAKTPRTGGLADLIKSLLSLFKRKGRK